MSVQNYFFLLVTIVSILCIAGCVQTQTSIPSAQVPVSTTITQAAVNTSTESPPQDPIGIIPGSPEPPVDEHLAKGLEYLRAGNFTRAIEELNLTLSGDPDNLDARMGRAQAYYAIGYPLLTNEARGTSEMDMAIRDYSFVIDRNPGNESAYIKRGLAHYFKAWPTPWYHLFYKKYAIPELDMAILDFSRALEINPDSVPARTGIAAARFDRSTGDGKYYFDNPSMRDQGREDIEYVFRYQAPDAFAHFVRGEFYNYDGFSTMAVEEYSNAIALDPNEAIYYRSRAKSYIRLEKFQEAREDISKALILQPRCLGALDYRRYMNDFRNNDWDATITDVNRMIEINPDIPRNYDMLGAYIVLKRGIKEDWEQALALENKAIALDPENYYYHGNKAICLEFLGYPHEAQQELLIYKQNARTVEEIEWVNQNLAGRKIISNILRKYL